MIVFTDGRTRAASRPRFENATAVISPFSVLVFAANVRRGLAPVSTVLTAWRTVATPFPCELAAATAQSTLIYEPFQADTRSPSALSPIWRFATACHPTVRDRRPHQEDHRGDRTSVRAPRGRAAGRGFEDACRGVGYLR